MSPSPHPQRIDGDDGHWYTYPPTGQLLRRVTSVIGGTQSKPWLEAWSAKLAVAWVLDNLPRLEEMGREAFENEARSAAARSRELKSAAGSYAHDVIEALILWQWRSTDPADSQAGTIPLPPLPDMLVGQVIDDVPAEMFADMCITGFVNFVADHDPEFLAAEMTVFNPAEGVAGTLDFIARLPKLGLTPCVDAKTGKHLESVQEQLAAYRRMPECQLPLGQLAPMPATDAGLVLHLRPEYERGYRLLLVSAGDDAAAWNRFRRAARLLDEREAVKGKPGTVLYPPLPDGSQPPMRLADLDGDGYGRAVTPLIRAGLATVADVAAFTAADCLAVKGVGPKSIVVIARMLADHGLSFATDKTDKQEAQVA